MAEQQGYRFGMGVPTEEVARLRVGMPARIKLDAYDHQKYGSLAGTVCFISLDSSAQDGQRPASYIVRMEVDGDEVGHGDLRGIVKLGMAGQREIVAGHECLLTVLLKKVHQTFCLG
jgi:adhesin transport system membrane fusion protein